MTIKPAKRLQNFPEYIFSRLNKEVAKVEATTGRKVLNFGAGSPDVPPSPEYVEKLTEFIHDSKAHVYPGYGPIPEYRDALISWHKNRFGVTLEKDEVYSLFGEKQAIALLPLAFLDEDDEVLIPDPGYQGFAGPAVMIGAKAVYYDLLEEDKYAINIDSLQAKVTERTKFMWVNAPSNPLGSVLSFDKLKAIVDFAKKNDIFIVYDNAYSEITFDGYVAPSILQIEGAKDIAVEINSFSKSFSLAGYRLGWIVGNKDIIATLAKVKSQMDSGIARPLQQLGAYILTHPDKKWQEQMIQSYKDRRDRIAIHLDKLGLIFTLPQASLYIWAKIPDEATDSETYAMNLLHEKQILLTPGVAFGNNGKRHVRVSICVNIDSIEEYFK